MSFAKKIAYNVVLNSLSKILATVLALIGIGFITRYLGKDGFGDYATVLAFFSLFSAIGDLGLYSIGTREISREKADEKKIISNVFTLRVASSLLLLILSPLIVWFLPYSLEIKTGIILIALAFSFSSSYMVLNGIFQKKLAMYKVAAIEFVGKAIQVGLVIYVIKQDWGFISIILAFLGGMIFNSLGVVLWSRRYIKFKFEVDLDYWKKFLKTSAPMGISVIVTFLYFKLDTILLSILGTSADVGIYNAAYKIIENITFFPAMIIGLILPVTSRYIFTKREKFVRISDKVFKLFLIIVIPLIIGTLFIADGVINLIGGGEFSESVWVLRVLIFSLSFIFFGHFFNNILIAGNMQKHLMWVLSLCAIFNISMNLIFIPLYFYKAAAVVSVLTELLVVVLTFSLVIIKLNYRPYVEKWFQILLSGGVMALIFWLFSGLHFLLLALLGSIIYFLALWITKAVSRKEVMSVVASS